MHLKFRNVNDAFFSLVSKIHSGEIPTVTRASRYGEVMMVEEPMIITYDHPRERVLFNEARDANPFFHLFESLWMLAGRNDVAPLAKYNSKIAEIASDDGKTFNGAYGYRWRKVSYLKCAGVMGGTTSLGEQIEKIEEYEGDQLEILIKHLKQKPESRRAVLQMWNVEDDLLNIDSSKDVCCNTHAYFSVELGMCSLCEGNCGPQPDGSMCDNCNGHPHDVPRYLNMTVCNRSNDLIWGMLGANVVHFSFLQEYVAACIGLEVGTYNQMTNNLHVYTDNWEPQKWLKHYHNRTMHDQPIITYEKHVKLIVPLVKDQMTFDLECAGFIDRDTDNRNWMEPFLQDVASPMCRAFELHKQRDYFHATRMAALVKSDDWRIAATNWINKRQDNWNNKIRETIGGIK